jgi:hypothetical protein
MARPKSIPQSTVDAVCKEYRTGSSIAVLESKYKVSHGWVINTLKKQGILTRPIGAPKAENPFVSLENFVAKLKERYNRGDIDEQQMEFEYKKFIAEYEKRQDLSWYSKEVPSGLYGESVHEAGDPKSEIANEDLRPQPSSSKGEIYDDMCKQILEDLEENKITKTEGQLKFMFLCDEFDELGQLDFDTKYAPQVNKGLGPVKE